MPLFEEIPQGDRVVKALYSKFNNPAITKSTLPYKIIGNKAKLQNLVTAFIAPMIAIENQYVESRVSGINGVYNVPIHFIYVHISVISCVTLPHGRRDPSRVLIPLPVDVVQIRIEELPVH